ncbi:beta-ketoacyl synthase N-terminal-like domain-containing protein [Hymenobacter psychrotolerans]|uniref:3-oxoacyl-(Acyl-carrier-protein) synthase n=1 Tax=Hymenobacter psychrotolerans DSM 18569 TaxID=1121959 RepID=A0A1M6W8T1_9BACT|nr:beta-ketoacyl synthase N-terminal-like domain-containing protein [Hymenobacter psychrotolerans]SHK90049.1 3-oxoacyl-(acyl-carrier-protein) synthase [Hymenobacter psychrotolerans DSM 18569]
MTEFAPDELIVIRGRGRVSALGLLPVPADTSVSPFTAHTTGPAVAALPPAAEATLAELRRSNAAYRQLDRTVLLGLLAARQATAAAGWRSGGLLNSGVGESEDCQPTTPPTHHSANPPLAVSIGSSRGATGRLEEFHTGFLTDGTVPVAASPLTTLGNVASWVAYDAGSTGGAALSHSSTCSSAFQALGNAVAWLRAGMATRFLAGGTEAPLTDFTLAQMQVIGIYSPYEAADWPCRPGAGRPSTFVLGEGAAVFALEKVSRPQLAAEKSEEPVFVLEGVGFGFEAIGSKTGLSADGQHFQQAIRQALAQARLTPADIDAVVLHSPGTPAGDAAERAALHAVFGDALPPLLSNKWLIGHTLGASAALSLDFALHVLETQQWPASPFATDVASRTPRPVRRILVNAAGFGGNAASVLVACL